MRRLLLLLASLLSSTIIAHSQDMQPDTDTAIYPMCRAIRRSTPENVRHVGRGVSAPQVIAKVDPKYSERARHMRLQGSSVLNLVVNKEGFPVDICIQRSLFDDLDQNAARAVSQWRFSPSMLDGQPVSVLISVEVAFRLYAKPDEVKESSISQSHF